MSGRWRRAPPSTVCGTGRSRKGTSARGPGCPATAGPGGIGTASRLVHTDGATWVLGALVLANFGRADDLLIAGVPVGRLLAAESNAAREYGSIVVVLATDAPLDARQLGRLARRVPHGLARTGSHGGHGSGDLALAFSVADRIAHYPQGPTRQTVTVDEGHPILDALFRATVETTEESVLNALCAATATDGRDGHRREALPHDRVRAFLQG